MAQVVWQEHLCLPNGSLTYIYNTNNTKQQRMCMKVSKTKKPGRQDHYCNKALLIKTHHLQNSHFVTYTLKQKGLSLPSKTR